MTEKALVITSIAGSDHPVLRRYAETCPKNGVRFILVGDVPSPKDFLLNGCEFYGIEDQEKLDFRILEKLPLRHYARKNLGYLLAIQRGARVIIETDDDNIPLSGFWDDRRESHEGRYSVDAGWVNVYRYYSRSQVWPRGFPLDRVSGQPPSLETLPLKETRCLIQQGLADDNPDVDALYRLILPLPIRFEQAGNVVLGNGSWCPFNSQNTTWFYDAFPLLYLPSFCSFRMTDIWRSFVAQRICWANGWGVLFHDPTVRQERNEHNLMKDFRDEIKGYLHNDAICEALASLELKAGVQNIPENMVRCYRRIVQLGHMEDKELELLDAWFLDLEKHTR